MPARVRRNPHNDLGNLAHYHLTIIRRKLEAHEEDGLSLDCMSFLIAEAFHVEALLNFLGSQCVKDWDDWWPYGKKRKNVLKAIGYDLSDTEEPRASLDLLKEVRDGLAHAKPADLIVEAKDDRAAMDNDWDQYLDPEFCEQVYQAIAAFKRTALERAGIPLGRTLTSSIGAAPKRPDQA
jgi:hypothetical protein